MNMFSDGAANVFSLVHEAKAGGEGHFAHDILA